MKPIARINARDEADAAAEWLLARRGDGLAWGDMAVLAPGKRNWRDPLITALTRADIPMRVLLGEPGRTPDRSEDCVHVMTLYAIEGFAFRAVAIVGVGDLPWKTQSVDESAALLQAATTQATDALLISYSKPSALVERLLSI